MIYCDSSFLIGLLLPNDFFHGPAAAEAVGFSESIPYIPLAELEVTNTFRRALKTGLITRSAHDAAFRQIEADLADGILARTDLLPAEHYRKARELSRRHTPKTGSRSLDILQTAAALLLNASAICSFDDRQRVLATAAGLEVIPHKMPRPKPRR